MKMKTEQGSGIFTKGAGERAPLFNISFVKGSHRMFPPFAIARVDKRLGTHVEESGHE